MPLMASAQSGGGGEDGDKPGAAEMGPELFRPEAADREFTCGGGSATSQDIDVTDANVNGSNGCFFAEAWELLPVSRASGFVI